MAKILEEFHSELINKWKAAKSAMDASKKLESELRIEVIENVFPNAGEGTSTHFFYDSQMDRKLKVNIRMNYKLNLSDLKDWEELMTEEEAACIKRKPSLDLAKYRQLEHSGLIDQCVEVSPGMPSLSLEDIFIITDNS
jgi:hypothetical protein|tara:strand:+ start:4102 stop:4518 length:417 start_codon:yes stop_codon:yes gene_type:complete